jgi:hypothetical protein
LFFAFALGRFDHGSSHKITVLSAALTAHEKLVAKGNYWWWLSIEIEFRNGF